MRSTPPAVLVVDDDQEVRTLLSGWLTEAGYACHVAAETSAALEEARRHHPSAAIVDIGLPGRDGLSLARELREGRSDLGVVLISGTRSFDAGVAALRIGVLDYLLKPCNRDDVLVSVHRALAWHRSVIEGHERRRVTEAELARRLTRLTEAVTTVSPASPGALDTLLMTLTASSPGLYPHMRRVALFSAAIADMIDLPAPAREQLERAALLHDVGTLAIPDIVLDKHSLLTPVELALVRSHSALAFEIIRGVPYLLPAAYLILATRERWEGEGDPVGLVGEQIPIEARIIAVANEFDVLTAARGYRGPVSRDEANTEIVRRAGTQFDPAIVRAWLRASETLSC